ncbi:elongator complex protein 1 [Cylas formicarius]|uniref:elongator complex protein 1 n=1 Tax=Cylas formicarius TaxID=197179 RepID=UPI00295871EC|nr:elongator complex protein 1 [Cylas formicarius]
MDNIEVFFREVKEINQQDAGNINIGHLGDNASCFSTDKNHLYLYEKQIDHVNPIGENIRDVKNLIYLSVRGVLFLTNDFDLIIYKIKSKEFVVVYSFAVKIESLAWNPNETCLVVCDYEETLYGLIFECNIDLQEYKFIEAWKSCLQDPVPNSVYVGWGSYNTQFKGSKKGEEEIKEIPQKYTPPTISWRGNGEQFVVNFWKEGRRYLKLFDSSLRPLYQSHAYPNLLPPISFKGQGNFIACSAVHNNQNKVVIFEKNCLLKSEFFIPEVRGEIKKLLYHPFHQILIIYSIEDTGHSTINIFLYLNAKWYLKQQLSYEAENQVKALSWSDNLQNFICKLNILTLHDVEHIVLRMVINRCPISGTVAVTDGSVVNFTFFSSEIVPPPMFSASLKLDKPINKIHFHPEIKLCILIDTTLNTQVVDFGNNILKKISYYVDQSVDELVRKLKLGGDNTNYLFFSDVIEVVEPINLNEGENSSLVYCTGCRIDGCFYEFALNQCHDLLINKNAVCSKVFSIFIYKSYFLFTHASCKLYCVRLTSDNVDQANWDLTKFYVRDIEQGARIVCVNEKAEIILELPRGNLEIIECRLICIDKVEKMMCDNKWQDAIMLIRQNKLNWNLLIDLNPQRFSDHVLEFAKAAESVSLLNSIVSELGTINCLQTMYSQCIKDSIPLHTVNTKHKILSQILNCIINLDPVTNLISIVILQIRHFTLKSALKSVHMVFKLGHLNICKKAIFQILLYHPSDIIINISFTLYDVDFMEFMHICCSQDPKVFEPQLKTLTNLETIDLRFQMNVLAKNYKGAVKFLLRCSRYHEDFIKEFIVKHEVHEEAYKSITRKNQNFDLCSQLFSTYLSTKLRYDEAGIILQRAELYNDAITEYKKSLNWNQVISLSVLLNVESSKRKEIISELARGLVKQDRIDEAVTLYEMHCEDYLSAISVLLDKNMFQKALCMARKYNSLDLIDKDIRPAIIKYRIDLYSRILDLEKQFLIHSDRLETVRYNKLLNLKNKYRNETCKMFGEYDHYSEYGSSISSYGSTVGSNKSKMSTTSAKNRRKLNKKKTDLREGSVFEDIALIRHLYLLTISIFDCGREVREICLTLTDDASFTYSAMLHRKLSEVQDKVKSIIPLIWSNTFVNAPHSIEPEILAVVQNREELDIEFRTPPLLKKLDDNWKLLIFQ